MSDITGALPDTEQGNRLGLVVRLLAIGLGIMSATTAARDGFQISLPSFLDSIMNVYSGWLESVALLVFGPAIKAIFAELRELIGWQLQLFPHWKHAVVLLWLLMAADARHPDQYEAPQTLKWILAAVCATIFGVMAGTVPLHQPSLFWWAAAGWFFFSSGSAALRATFRRRDEQTWLEQFTAVGLPHLILGFACVWGGALGDRGVTWLTSNPSAYWLPFAIFWAYLMALNFLRSDWISALRDAPAGAITLALAAGYPREVGMMVATSASPGLAAFILLCVILGVWSLLYAYDEEGKVLTGAALTGLDTLSILGGAAFLVWLGHALA